MLQQHNYENLFNSIKQQIIIEKSQFIYKSVSYGVSLLIININSIIKYCIIKNNFADIRGAVYYSSEKESQYIFDSKIIENKSEISRSIYLGFQPLKTNNINIIYQWRLNIRRNKQEFLIKRLLNKLFLIHIRYQVPLRKIINQYCLLVQQQTIIGILIQSNQNLFLIILHLGLLLWISLMNKLWGCKILIVFDIQKLIIQVLKKINMMYLMKLLVIIIQIIQLFTSILLIIKIQFFDCKFNVIVFQSLYMKRVHFFQFIIMSQIINFRWTQKHFLVNQVNSQIKLLVNVFFDIHFKIYIKYLGQHILSFGGEQQWWLETSR
ncbi:unnamed protein product [Paramecium primaurelia]|uniref:Transmembrane protein n=1 Tax=Paramecium primaurelia TaxID=5886 RepID=A0A8S1QKP3_PARPR|nr:unnamed protein product [Paramecium primaurelia]